MPWTAKDATEHTKAADTDAKRERWAAVANSALAKCMEDGGDEDECAASAIRQASGSVNEEAGTMPDEMNEVTENTEAPNTEATCTEYIGGLEQYLSRVRSAFYSAFRKSAPAIEGDPDFWVRDILSGHPLLGDAVVVEGNGGLFAAPYTIGEDGMITFADAGKWESVVMTYIRAPSAQMETESAEVDFAESAIGHVISLAEQLPLPGADQIVPLHLDVAIITPGWGNKHDNHYYPRDVVERDSGVFAGVKMFETDHRQDEKSTRTWVSTVKEIAGYTDDGAPIGRVSVHDEHFAKRLMALAADDLLEKMECSILAAGTAKKGEVDGKKGHVVEAITSAESVDWVTRAGAGGRALSLAESQTGGESMEQETKPIEEQEPTEEQLEEVTLQEQEPEEPPAPAMLEPEKVHEMVEATNLPDAAKARLSKAEYADEDELEGVISGEVAYIKELTGSGKPFAQGAGSAPEKRPRTVEEANADFNRILSEVGMPNLVVVGGKSS